MSRVAEVVVAFEQPRARPGVWELSSGLEVGVSPQEAASRTLLGSGMDQNLIREMLIDRMRRHSESLHQAAATVTRGFGVAPDVVSPAVESIRREGRKNMLLDSPPGVFDPGAEGEARLAGWYTGPEDGDELWPRFRAKLETGPMRSVVDDIDAASTKVVAHFADPHIWNLKKRGLVVGYVQSGKTANYTAVMAKAADAGYKMFIVLAGLHNNLRRQTQVRLSKDLVDYDWTPLTSNDQDFGNVVNGAAMLGRGVNTIAVVKKNPARLRRLRDWLRDIPEGIRERVPVLLLDDEADQATPNSAAGRDQMTRINQLTRQIWGEIRTGTYVGYTASPFANIFMNPADDEELYPADFIIDLPRPEAYFGAERVFGREPLNDADDPDVGLDMVRDVPDDDALVLRPSSSAEDRATFDPELPPSLVDAVCWFVVACAIRRARGEADQHSSMLVHTTHYVLPHFAMKRRLDDLLESLRGEVADGDLDRFAASFETESVRAISVASQGVPSWPSVASEIPAVLAAIRVVVDNGSSMDRLDYEKSDESGDPIAETVIAVGGGTLSRGLTLEGLMVSYFTRTSNTYDTLLQMGRWFGYRQGYEDLPRIWMQPSLAAEFRFLALVEEEIRQDMRHMERMNVTPRQLGIRVRAHPGRLSIVARNKMHHADLVRVSYSGNRLQTFILDETDRDVLDQNLRAARAMVEGCAARSEPIVRDNRWMFRDVDAGVILDLLDGYRFHVDQATMNRAHMSAWVRNVARDRPWNVVVVGGERRLRKIDGDVVDLGSVDLGLGSEVPTVNRAPLSNEPVGRANIKALLSHADWFADLEPSLVRGLDDVQRRDPRAVREKHADGRGLLVLYPVSKNSVPMRQAARLLRSRRPMRAPEHLIGLGLIFPAIDREGFADEGTYYSVHPDWEEEVGDDEMPEDLEGSMVVDGDAIGGRR